MRIENRTSCDPLRCLPGWGTLALPVRVRLLGCLYNHTLLILPKSDVSPKSIGAPTEVLLNIPWVITYHLCIIKGKLDCCSFKTEREVNFDGERTHAVSELLWLVVLNVLVFYCWPTKLRKGNVFICVCLSLILSRGGVPCDHYPWCIGPHDTITPHAPLQPHPKYIQTCSTWTSLYKDTFWSRWRSVQICSLVEPQCKHMVATEAITYGRQADGTHPIGMLSCLLLKLIVINVHISNLKHLRPKTMKADKAVQFQYFNVSKTKQEPGKLKQI